MAKKTSDEKVGSSSSRKSDNKKSFGTKTEEKSTKKSVVKKDNKIKSSVETKNKKVVSVKKVEDTKNNKGSSKKETKNNNINKTKDEKKRRLFFAKKDKVSEPVKKYRKKKLKKEKQKRIVDGKFSLDILDLLIMIVLTAIVSCVLTGVILNFQYRNKIDLFNVDIVDDENVKNFLSTYSEIIENYYEEVDADAMMAAALDGMLEFLKDNYSIYMNKDETNSLDEMLDGSYDGVGLALNGNIVIEVYEGSSAYEEGVKVGDEVIRINGFDISMANYEDIEKSLVHDGPNEVVVRRNNEELTVTLETGRVNVPSTSVDVINSKDKDKKIGRISLVSFSSLAFDEFNEELKKLENEEKIDALIIDLRNNTGGYLNVASNIASLFLEKGQMIYSLESKDKVTEYKDDDKESRNYEIVVLVNGNTASAAEILAAALHDSYGATIVGHTTFGKGKVQTMKHYEDTMVKYTSAKWLRPNGECVDGVGIEPDYKIDNIYDGNIIYDKQLDKAIELLS